MITRHTQSIDRAPSRFHLGLSENPHPPLPSVIAALDRASRRANRYPEFLPNSLADIIAEHEGLDAEHVVVGAGATGVAMQVLRSMTSREDRTVFSVPTFDGYPIMTEMCGLNAHTVALDGNGMQDLFAMRRSIDERTTLAIVCRPHNPTGTLTPIGDLVDFLRSMPDHVTTILDEAYIEFVEPDLQIDVPALISEYPGVVVLRTFSKAYGLAGLRIGYGLASAGLACRIRRLQLPFGMVAAAEDAVTASYAAAAELTDRVNSIVTERERLRADLCARGVVTPDSHANFLYLPGASIGGALADAGIASRRYANGDARIAVGDPRAGRAVLEAVTSG